MRRSKSGYLTTFNTQKRTKYSDKVTSKVKKLTEQGLSARKIATKIGIPYSSVYNIIRRVCPNLEDSSRPSSKYINRQEARSILDMSDSSWDYYRGAYPERFVKKGIVVWGEREFLIDHKLFREGYKR